MGERRRAGDFCAMGVWGAEKIAGHRSKGSLRPCGISGPAWHLLSQPLPHPRRTLKQLMLHTALLGSEAGAHQGFGVLGPPHGLWWGSQCLAQEVFVFSSVAGRALWEDRARATNTTWQLTLTPSPKTISSECPLPSGWNPSQFSSGDVQGVIIGEDATNFFIIV